MGDVNRRRFLLAAESLHMEIRGRCPAFAQFGSDLDPATQAQLARGERLVEILKQGQYEPLAVEKQIIIIYAATKGFLDGYPVNVLGRYEEELNSFFESKHQGLLTEIREKKKIDEALEAKLKGALEEFNGLFVAEETK